MRRYIILALCMLLVMEFASAGVLYSGELYSTTQFIMANQTYTALGTKIVANSDFPDNFTQIAVYPSSNGTRTGTPVVIDYGKCTLVEYDTYCFTDLRYNFNDPNVTDSTGRIRPLIKLVITHNEPSIKVERPTTINLDFNETTQIPIRIKNSGIKPITITYTELVPTGFIIVKAENASVTDNLIYLTITINDNTTKSLSYSIKNKDYKDRNWTATYSYTYENKQYNINTTKLTAKAVPAYTIKGTFSKSSSGDIGESFDYTIAVTNNDVNELLDTQIMVDPGTLKVNNAQNLEETEGYYTGQVLVPTKGTTYFTLVATANHVGNNTISSSIQMYINGFDFSTELNSSYILKVKGITPSFTSNKETIKPNDSLTIRLYLNNSDPEENYKNIKGTIKGLKNENIDLSYLEQGKSYFAEYTYTVPESIFNITNQTKLILVFNGTYTTVAGEALKLSVSKSLTLNQSYIAWKSAVKATTKIPTKTTTTPTKAQANTTAGKSNNTTVYINKTSVKTNNSDKNSTIVIDQKKDWFTSFFDSLNAFVKKLFGSK